MKSETSLIMYWIKEKNAKELQMKICSCKKVKRCFVYELESHSGSVSKRGS